MPGTVNSPCEAACVNYLLVKKILFLKFLRIIVKLSLFSPVSSKSDFKTNNVQNIKLLKRRKNTMTSVDFHCT